MALFTFVARDPLTGKAMRINSLQPATDSDRAHFAERQEVAQQRRAARKAASAAVFTGRPPPPSSHSGRHQLKGSQGEEGGPHCATPASKLDNTKDCAVDDGSAVQTRAAGRRSGLKHSWLRPGRCSTCQRLRRATQCSCSTRGCRTPSPASLSSATCMVVSLAGFS